MMFDDFMRIKIGQTLFSASALVVLLWGLGSLRTTHANPNGYLMDIQMVPAVCALDPSKARKRKCLEGYSLNIAGLYPLKPEKDCRTQSSATLPPLQAKVVAKVMPDQTARMQLWQAYGGCFSMTASQYFRMIINFADRLNVPLELSAAETKQIQHQALRTQFLRLNRDLNTNAFHFSCHRLGNQVFLSSVKMCYSKKGTYQSCPRELLTNCPKTFLIKGSF